MPKLPTVLLVALLVHPGVSIAQDITPPEADPRIRKLVASISEERLSALVQKLAGFGTRHTLSDTDSPTRGIGAARQWISVGTGSGTFYKRAVHRATHFS